MASRKAFSDTTVVHRIDSLLVPARADVRGRYRRCYYRKAAQNYAALLKLGELVRIPYLSGAHHPTVGIPCELYLAIILCGIPSLRRQESSVSMWPDF